MLNKQEVLDQTTLLTEMKELVDAYEEIAVTRIRRVKSYVLQTREFLAGVTNVFQRVKSSYQNELQGLMRQKKIHDPSKITLIKRNGKTVCMLLSANTILYGDIIHKTFLRFSEYISTNVVDIVVVGRIGKQMFENAYPGKQYTYFDLPDTKTDPNTLKQIAAFTLNYQKILVFYAQFENMVSQAPVVFDIYGSQELSMELQQPKNRYFFEPSLETIAVFFETEVYASILEQTLQESMLAKIAARLLVLDRAIDNITNQLRRQQLALRIEPHREINKKQLDGLAGMTLWKTGGGNG